MKELDSKERCEAATGSEALDCTERMGSELNPSKVMLVGRKGSHFLISIHLRESPPCDCLAEKAVEAEEGLLLFTLALTPRIQWDSSFSSSSFRINR